MKTQEQIIIKQAIQRIYIRNQVELENLLTLEEALQNQKITEEEWKEMFRARGSEDAIQKQIYSAQMVRLLSLQAVILPATLPKLLGWLEKREKNEEEKKVFIDFQKQVRQLLARNNPESEFLALKQKVIEGVRRLIPSVVKQPDLLKPIASLLKPQNGLWGHFYHYHVKGEIEQDLTTAYELIQGYQSDTALVLIEEPLWEELFHNIQSIWERDRVSPQEKYLPLAQLFEQVSYLKASALFYHIALGEVPGEVFDNCSGRGNRSRKEIYGVSVKRHFTLFEKLWNKPF